MSHSIITAMVVTKQGDNLLLAARSASSNVFPKTYRWGFFGTTFENEAAVKGMLFKERLAGNLKFTSTLQRLRTCTPEQLEPEIRTALDGLAGRDMSKFTVAEAIDDMQECCLNEFYSATELAKLEGAVRALKTGTPVPNPNDETAGEYRSAYPLLSAIDQYGLPWITKAQLKEAPSLALEVGPFGVTPLYRLSTVYAWGEEMKAGVLQSARAIIEAGKRHQILSLRGGADPDARNVLGRSALHGAVGSTVTYNPALVELLVEEGARINAVDAQGNTPLHIAARHQHRDGEPALQAFRHLLSMGADASMANLAGQFPRDLASAGEPVRALLDEALLAAQDAAGQLPEDSSETAERERQRG